jgi:hypothetical protein
MLLVSELTEFSLDLWDVLEVKHVLGAEMRDKKTALKK